MMKVNMISKGLIFALASTSLAGMAVPVFAQDAAEEAEGGDIIVTARRRDETLQSTPIAITAISTGQIEDKGAVNMGDLQGTAPNLLITQQNSGAASANLSIRGLTFADIEKSFDPTVGVVVDGVFLGTSTGQFFDFFDIAQIEVLRGPQGTLFGRNTIGGVINIKRSKPKDELGGKIEASYGSFKSKAVRAVFNVPIIENGLTSKVWYFHNDTDGFHRQGTGPGVINPGSRRGGANNENFGISLLAKPSDNFDALLTVEKQVQDFETVNSSLTQSSELFCNIAALGGAASPLAPPANQCNRNNRKDLYTVFGQPTGGTYRSPAVTLELNGDLGGVKLTSVSGYRKSTEAQTQDFDSSSPNLYLTDRRQNFRQYSQEIRAAGKFTDSFDYVVGAYYYDGRYTLIQDTLFFGGPLPTQTVSGKATSLALFGDFNVSLAEKFRVNFGGRYTKDKKSLNNFVGAFLGNPKDSFKKFTPKVSVDYRPNDDHLVYASWSRGYRSGGFSNRAQTAASTLAPYDSETVDSYEIGWKAAFLDRKVQLNVAAFYSDYQDLQQNTTIAAIVGGVSTNETIVSNVGSSIVKGLEADLTIKPTKGLTFSGTLGILDRKFKGFITQAPGATAFLDTYDYTAVDAIYSPKFNASMNATYEAETSFGSITSNVGVRFIGKYDQQISIGANTARVLANGSTLFTVLNNDPRVRTDNQALLDASISTKFDLGGAKAKLTVYGRNLLDDRGPSAAFTVADNPTNTGLWSFASAREPASYGVSLGFEF
jgi:iron complex outermembrane recepter protein